MTRTKDNTMAFMTKNTIQYLTLYSMTWCLFMLGACAPVGDGDGGGDGDGERCGDERCTGDEDIDNCPRDCSGSGDEDCGDGVCDVEGGEFCGTCLADCMCEEGQRCDVDAMACTSLCEDRECGDDGFGDSCGVCDEGLACNAEGACQEVPETCGNEACDEGEDCSLCPQDCGECCGDGSCDEGVGENCTTCDADCGCAEGTACEETLRSCVEVCVPDCSGKACGPDGCGGSCGECVDGECTEEQICEGEASPDAPRILDFSTNVLRLTDGESVVFTAVVTDPDGIEDLIGGNMVDPGTGATYGAFATAASEGAYSLTLSWAEIDTVDTLSFGTQEQERRFQATFFDAAGNQTQELITLTMYCEADRGACGNGTCQDLRNDDNNCGDCNNTCGNNSFCDNGNCACDGGFEGQVLECGGECVNVFDDPNNCGVCGNVCDSGDCLQGICNCNSNDQCGPGESCPTSSVFESGFCLGLDAARLNDTNIPPFFGGSTVGAAEISSPGLEQDLGSPWLTFCNPTEMQADLLCKEALGNDMEGQLLPEELRDSLSNLPQNTEFSISDMQCPSNATRLADCTFGRFDATCPDNINYVFCVPAGTFDTERSIDGGCEDDIDNDMDGSTDCDDPDCAEEPVCDEPGDQTCLPTVGEVTRGSMINDGLTEGLSDGPRQGAYYDAYTLTVTNTNAYTITMDALFDTYLFVMNANNCDIVGENDDRSQGNTNSTLTITLNRGTYLVIATSYNTANNTTGTYTLNVE